MKKIRRESKALKREFDAAHAEGQRAIRRGDYKRVQAIALRERQLIERSKQLADALGDEVHRKNPKARKRTAKNR